MKHMGFKAAASSIMRRERVSKAAAGRILGYGKSHASAAALRKNPRLRRTAGYVRNHGY